MTEAEWLACEDPKPMLAFLLGKASGRKIRLTGVACCRLFVDRFPSKALHRGIEIAERYADGLASITELEHNAQALWPFIDNGGEPVRYAADIILTASEKYPGTALPWPPQSAAESAFESYGGDGFDDPEEAAGFTLAPDHCRQAGLIRDIFGNPFAPVAFSPAWRTDTAVTLARTMYESREFSAMPILADALQDAGCENDDILAHCRGDGPHVRGCWVVDLVLGKE